MKPLTLVLITLIATCVLVATASACAEPLTQGYWKTHSAYGPAPYDETWACLEEEEDTPFFDSGYSYYEVLTTPPRGGNAYFILAHQWIAAKLNMANGAKMPCSAFDANMGAYYLLRDYADEMWIPKKCDDRELAIEYACILEKFNSGQL